MPSNPRVLVVRFGSLGDVVLATPVLRAIRRRYPEAHLTVVTRSAYAELLGSNPAVTEVVGAESRESTARLVGRLGRERFDYGLDLQRSLTSLRLRGRVRTTWGLAPKARGARLALLWTGDTSRSIPHATRRYFAAARPLGIEDDGGGPELVLTEDDRSAAAGIAPAGCVALAPGALWASKRWPPARWRDLGHRLAAAGHTVVAVGAAGERGLLDGPGIAAVYGAPLRVAAAVLARARVAVTHDSGAMHLAAAVGTRVVALHGPTVPALGFVPRGTRVEVVECSLPCRPCSPFGSDECPLGHHRCMREIEPATVAALVEAA